MNQDSCSCNLKCIMILLHLLFHSLNNCRPRLGTPNTLRGVNAPTTVATLISILSICSYTVAAVLLQTTINYIS